MQLRSSMKVRIATTSIALAVGIFTLVLGAALRGETKETSGEQLCAAITWPMIPANCLEGIAVGREVRMVGADVDAFDAEADAEDQEERADMQARFAADFD
jgi:hypothetical protein